MLPCYRYLCFYFLSNVVEWTTSYDTWLFEKKLLLSFFYRKRFPWNSRVSHLGIMLVGVLYFCTSQFIVYICTGTVCVCSMTKWSYLASPCETERLTSNQAREWPAKEDRWLDRTCAWCHCRMSEVVWQVARLITPDYYWWKVMFGRAVPLTTKPPQWMSPWTHVSCGHGNLSYPFPQTLLFSSLRDPVQTLQASGWIWHR